MKADELKSIIEKHKKWLNNEVGGERAELRGGDLSGVDLSGVDLRGAALFGVYLRYLRGADLRGADLRYANLCHAELRGADLRGADLLGAELRYANLCGANLLDANLFGADLRHANLCGVKDVSYVPMACPDSGSFTAWKKANGLIVKLLIPEDARRSSATGRKCRCDKAIVLAIEQINGEMAETNVVNSDYDDSFVYEVGKTIEEQNFCTDRFQECAAGIHFFINRQDAVDYI